MEETYYLVDFENVGLKGLEGARSLTKGDWVHLFSTRNAPKINTATLANFNATNLLVHEVPAKSQSVDMHLVSYLGYLLGSCEDTPEIVILSNDTDYDDIVSYWKKEKGVIIKRRESILAEAPKPAAKPARAKRTVTAKKAAKEEKPQTEEKPAVPEKTQQKTKRTATAKKTAKEEKPQAEEKPAVPEKTQQKTKRTATAKKAAKEEKPQTEEKPAAPEKAQQKTKRTAKVKTVEPEDKTALNNAVLKVLSNAKYDNETVSFAASLVTKNFAEKGGKQIIYRTIISKFGQERGLAIYRYIQKLL